MASNTSKLVRVLSRQHAPSGAVARREFSAMVTPTDEFPGYVLLACHVCKIDQKR